MDPQRQYAQLLTLWSQGSKMFRRSQHLLKHRDEGWDSWWRLGRRLVERRMTVLPLPLPDPYLLVGTESEWFTLCPAGLQDVGVARGQVIEVAPDGSDALCWQGRWTIRMDVALRLGQRGWDTLCRWPREDAPRVTIAGLDGALTLLGALGRWPTLFAALQPEDWALASELLRHPMRRLEAPRPLPESWGFCWEAETHEAWWQRQDEDSVHTR